MSEQPMSGPDASTRTLHDYRALLQRHWRLIVAGIVLGGLVGGWLGTMKPSTYTSAASVLVTPTGAESGADIANSRTRAVVNLDTEAQLVRSERVGERVASLLGSTRTPQQLTHDLAVEVPPNSTLLVLRYSGGTPTEAQRGADAFAQAYLDVREADAQAAVTRQIAKSTKVSDDLQARLAVAASRVQAVRDKSDRVLAEAERNRLEQALTSTQIKVSNLRAVQVDPGQLVSAASAPSSNGRTFLLTTVVSGAFLGFLVALAASGLRERYGTRLTGIPDVERISGRRVLMRLPDTLDPTGKPTLEQAGRQGREFLRLSKVMAHLDHQRRNVVLVAGASRGPAAALVGAGLAQALARTGAKVALVRGDDEPVPYVQAEAGIAEVMRGELTVPQALGRERGSVGSMAVLSRGNGRSADDLISPRFDIVIAELLALVDHVILVAPATSVSAEAQHLVERSDIVLLAVDERTTTRGQLHDAAAQIEEVEAAAVGVVLVRTAGRRKGRLAKAAPPGRPATARTSPATSVPVPVEDRLHSPGGTGANGASAAGTSTTGAAGGDTAPGAGQEPGSGTPAVSTGGRGKS